jgi:hypothetical protein
MIVLVVVSKRRPLMLSTIVRSSSPRGVGIGATRGDEEACPPASAGRPIGIAASMLLY